MSVKSIAVHFQSKNSIEYMNITRDPKSFFKITFHMFQWIDFAIFCSFPRKIRELDIFSVQMHNQAFYLGVLPRFFWVPCVFSRDENSCRQKSWKYRLAMFLKPFYKVLWTTGLEIHDSIKGICCGAHLKGICHGAHLNCLSVSLCSKANLPSVFSIKKCPICIFHKKCPFWANISVPFDPEIQALTIHKHI
jgi:hypothetical protein